MGWQAGQEFYDDKILAISTIVIGNVVQTLPS
jgi:hypothetical protein